VRLRPRPSVWDPPLQYIYLFEISQPKRDKIAVAWLLLID
jgi:hypothetical protein